MKVQRAFDSHISELPGNQVFLDLGATDDVTGQVKGRFFHRLIGPFLYGMRYNIKEKACDRKSSIGVIENHR